jgi:hypothetical protein
MPCRKLQFFPPHSSYFSEKKKKINCSFHFPAAFSNPTYQLHATVSISPTPQPSLTKQINIDAAMLQQPSPDKQSIAIVLMLTSYMRLF